MSPDDGARSPGKVDAGGGATPSDGGQAPSPTGQAPSPTGPTPASTGPAPSRDGPAPAPSGRKKKQRDRSWPPAAPTLPFPVPDNHTHLDSDLGEPHLSLAEQLERAEAAGVPGVLTVGCDLPDARWTAAVVGTDPRLLGAVAIHPNEAPRLAEAGTWPGAMAEIADLARTERIRAVGETGLDFYRTGPEGREVQFEAFRAHIALAKELGLALQIHDRDAHREVVQTLLADGAPPRTVFHCFSGDAELAGICAEHGWYMSFAGTVTFGPNEDLRAALRAAPVELVMVETDAPYLTAMPYRGRPNAPYLMPWTVRGMAQTLERDLEELCRRLARTTQEVYGPW